MVPFVVVQLDTRAKAIHAKVKICANSTSYDNQMSDIFAASVAVVFLAKVFDGSYNNTVRPPLNASTNLGCRCYRLWHYVYAFLQRLPSLYLLFRLGLFFLALNVFFEARKKIPYSYREQPRQRNQTSSGILV